MYYIVDANNLAGSLNLLAEPDFDQKLIVLMQAWLADKRVNVILVFDSLCSAGDHLSYKHLEVIYAPRDDYYHSADDKIIEIFRQIGIQRNISTNSTFSFTIINKLINHNLVLVSNDIDLQKRAQAICSQNKTSLKSLVNQKFINLFFKEDLSITTVDENRGLSDGEQAEIEKDLLALWQ